MRKFLNGVALLFLMVLLLDWCLPAKAAWAPSPTTVVVPAIPSDNATYPTLASLKDGWYQAPLYGPHWQIRYQSGRLTEVWNYRTSQYLSWTNGQWVTIVREPETLSVAPVENFGVEKDPVERAPGKYYKGEPITKAKALDLIARADGDDVEGKADFPDENKVGWLIFIGPKAKAGEVQAQLNSCPKLKAKVWFQAYDPSDKRDWPVEMFALRENKKFKDMALYLECLDGSVCHGQYDLKAGDIQKLEQNFKPEAVPDIRNKTFIEKVNDYADENPAHCVLAAAAVVGLLHYRRQQKGGK